MSNCSNHKKDLMGETDMKVVAEAIGDLHYEATAELFKYLAGKYWVDSFYDADAGKKDLATQLKYIHHAMTIAAFGAERCWEISKPFMDGKDETNKGASSAP